MFLGQSRAPEVEVVASDQLCYRTSQLFQVEPLSLWRQQNLESLETVYMSFLGESYYGSCGGPLGGGAGEANSIIIFSTASSWGSSDARPGGCCPV